MAITDFIAAILPTSSTVSGIAGRKNADGSIEVLAYASRDASAFMRKGVVQNIDKAAQALALVKQDLEQQLGCTIAKVYTGISGQSLRAVENVVNRVLDQDTIITRELVDSISDENRATAIDGLEMLGEVPQEYVVNHIPVDDPVGVNGRNITARFLNLMARPELKRNLEASFNQAQIDVVDILVAPLQLAKAVLTDRQLRSGCALIDIGADTTTVTIYKRDALRSLAILPLGSHSITRDLTELKIEEEEAERLKIEYGDAAYEEEEGGPNANAHCTTEDGRTIALAELNDIVGARAEELIDNAYNLMQQCPYADKLNAGIVLTGGGARLKNIEELVRKVAKDKSKKVATPQWTPKGLPGMAVGGRTEPLSGPTNAAPLVGLLIEANENCAISADEKERQEAEAKKKAEQETKAKAQAEAAKPPVQPQGQKPTQQTKKPADKKKRGRWKNLVEGFSGSLFGEDDDQVLN